MTNIVSYPATQAAASTTSRTPDFNWVPVRISELWEGAVLVRSQAAATKANVVGVVKTVDWSGASPVIVFTDGRRARKANGTKVCVGKRYGGRSAPWLTAEDVA